MPFEPQDSATTYLSRLGTGAEQAATVLVDAELRGEGISAQLVRFDIPAPTAATLRNPGAYLINLCLTPRPLDTTAGYPEHWGPHRQERVGDIFMVPPGEGLFIAGGTVRQLSLVCELAPALVHQCIGQELDWNEQRLASTLDISSARIRALLFRLTEEVRHPGLSSDRMLAFLAGELAIEIGRYCLEQAERPVMGGLAGWRLRLIDERLAGDPSAPSLKELAGICSLSVRQLTRGFRVSRGCSIGDYIEQRRMETAKRLLMKGQTVKEIAFAMGFSSAPAFTYAFRRAVGISPTHFRQRQAGSLERT